jgi:hypothetical protein
MCRIKEFSELKNLILSEGYGLILLKSDNPANPDSDYDFKSCILKTFKSTQACLYKRGCSTTQEHV